MSKVTHSFEGEEITEQGHDDLRALLTNRNGSYLSISSAAKSRYDGFFWKKDRMFRIIDEIKVLQAATPKKITNNFSSISREFGSFSESFFVPKHKDGFFYEINHKKTITFDFDVRESYDNRIWGMNYEIALSEGNALITFTKKNDEREPKGNEFTLYVSLKSDGDVKLIKDWVKKGYESDKKRNSEPHERHVFRALEVHATKVAVGVGLNEEAAIDSANDIFDNHNEMKIELEKDLKEILGWNLDDQKVNMAFKCAISSLDSLRTDEGILAGLPWFFQIWSRDQAISLKALMLQKEYAYSRKLIEKMLDSRDNKGRISNIISGGALNSADATGWVVQRLWDLTELLDKDGQLRLYFTKNEIEQIVSKVEGIIDEVTKNFAREGLVQNDALETWMDTKFANDVRAGARIEIQALQIACYKFLLKMTGKKFYAALADNAIKNIRKRLFNERFLLDGADDETIRPNIFIAYYAAPEILDRSEWGMAFDYALRALWDYWGGLATIDKSNKLFCNESTGQDTKSYHRGDSWFWINNLSAICLYKYDKKRYKREIEKILEASTDEILFHGCVGHHSELSSSEDLKAEGCWAQAWSAAMFIELIHELFVR